MRPVTIGNPPNYPYDNAAAENNNNVPAFSATSSMATAYGWGAPTARSVTWVLNQLLDKAVNGTAFPASNTAQVRTRAIKAMRKRLEAIHVTARGDMVAMIGDFCSFCEMPLAGHLLAIEHVAPKSIYPTYSVWWWNFLLACRDCNSQKGNVPSRATTLGWTGLPAPTEVQRVNQIHTHYYWPDRDTDTYRIVSRQYWYDTHTGAPVQLTPAEYASRNNRLIAFTATRVRADIDTTAGGMVLYTRSESRIVNNGGNNPGNRTVTLTGLALQETARAALRTRTWLFICTHYSTIVDTVIALPLINRPAMFTGMWNMFLAMAVQGGFYSVWVDVLSQRGFPNGSNGSVGGTYGNVGDRFVNDTQVGNAPNVFCEFRGTDVTDVP
jgi:hypothetical protein